MPKDPKSTSVTLQMAKLSLEEVFWLAEGHEYLPWKICIGTFQWTATVEFILMGFYLCFEIF